MKSKFKLTLALLVFSTMLVSAAGADYTKKNQESISKRCYYRLESDEQIRRGKNQ